MKNSKHASFRFSSNSSTTTCAEAHLLIPGMMGFMSAHVLINKERVQRGRESLKRSVYLDRVCQLQAEFMAEHGELSFTCDTTQELKQLLNSNSAGENVQRGPDVETMHADSMKSGRSAFKRILNKKFTEFGVGTARGKDGKLYMVQLFRGHTEEDHEICKQ